MLPMVAQARADLADTTPPQQGEGGIAQQGHDRRGEVGVQRRGEGARRAGGATGLWCVRPCTLHGTLVGGDSAHQTRLSSHKESLFATLSLTHNPHEGRYAMIADRLKLARR